MFDVAKDCTVIKLLKMCSDKGFCVNTTLRPGHTDICHRSEQNRPDRTYPDCY